MLDQVSIWQGIAAIAGLVVISNAGLVWAVKWITAANWKKLSRDISAVHESNGALKDELARLKETLPREYVRREDWIMGFSRIEQKIDAIWNYIHQEGRRQKEG